LQTIQNVLDSLPAESAPQTRFDLDRMKNQINQLQAQVEQLTRKISAPAPVAAPAEKSGK
jgi:small-conductance mechanosensitive channel